MTKKLFLVFLLSLAISFIWWPGEVLAYQPPAMITFTFDDGAKSIYERAMPIFAQYKIPAVFYGETGPLNSGEDWVMTWDQVRSLRDQYGWEIGSHSVWHPYLTQVSDEQLIQELLGAKQDFAAQGIEVKTFATPYGDYDARVLTAIARYYESHRAAWAGPNYWPEAWNDYTVVTKEVTHHTTPRTVMRWIDEAIAKKQWLVLLFHNIVRRRAGEYEYNEDKLEQIVRYATRKPIKVVTTSEALRFSSQPNLVSNFTFSELDGTGWAQNWTRTSETNVLIDQGNHGNVFGSQNSLKIMGSAEQNEARSNLIVIDSAPEYLLRMYQNVQNRVSGGWAVYVSEFDANDTWLGGQWLGGNYANFIGYRYYQYTPSSAAVAKIIIHIFSETNSQLTLYADSVELKAVP